MFGWRSRFFLILAWLFSAGLSHGGETLVLCHEQADVRPWRTLEGTGMHFELINRAAKEAGVTVRYDPVPWKRCLANLKSGLADGAFGASYLQERSEYAVYPGGNTLDSNKRLNIDRYVLLRRIGSPVQWDGRKLSGINNKVGIPLGYSVSKFLVDNGAAVDDSALSVLEVAQKLAAGRVDAAAVLVGEITTLFNQSPQLKKRIEALPIPLQEKPYFLIFAKTYHSQHRDTVEQFWKAIEKSRNSAEYQKLERQALRNMSQ